MSGREKRGVYTIPAGVPFARSLARALLAETREDPLALSRYRLLLPTRRACRSVREAFLRETEGRPLLLPHMQPLGDVDADELDFSYGGGLPGKVSLEIPPALPSLQRQLWLARAIMKTDGYEQGAEHAMKLAAALGRLMDHIYTENLDLSALENLVDDVFADHWQITLKFLKILSHVWPEALAQMGMIDEADRRNRLILALAKSWENAPPQGPVVAAGSTGSIPATAALMKVIAALPQGRIILPGLDQDMDEESWGVLDDTHPQATLKSLLQSLEVERENVALWPQHKKREGKRADQGYGGKRRLLASEMMRPAPTTNKWAALKNLDADSRDAITATLDGIMRADCETIREEARLIALLIRECLETPGKTAALVTPDRELARRVAMICEKWEIQLDDSAGQPLPETLTGSYIRIVAQACAEGLSPVLLLGMLRHKHCRMGVSVSALQKTVARIEKAALRGLKPQAGIDGLKKRLTDERVVKKILPEDSAFVDALAACLYPLLQLLDKEQDTQAFSEWLDAHIATVEALAATDKKEGASVLWTGDDGEAAAAFLSRLRDVAYDFPKVTCVQYLAILEELMKGVIVRPAYGTHPRLSILGPLEARLLQADLVILGGLNEGTWPPDPGHDPWMSRPMKKDFGLPGPERRIGLSAHDFVQGFCASDVVLTRAKRREGAPTVPARWLQRLDAVLQALGNDPALLSKRGDIYIKLGEIMDYSATVTPCARPKPSPPVSLRPRRLSVTQIETLMGDPYSTYARHILRLKKLDPLEKQPDAAERGEVLHAVMERFLKECGKSLPPREDTLALLYRIGRELIDQRTDDPGFWEFWWPRFENLCGWIVDQEGIWRQTATPLATEVKGQYTFAAPGGDFTVSARADRIDSLAGGGVAIIDYKSGGTYSKKAMMSGSSPQLPLEGVMAVNGGFESVSASLPGYLGYWVMTGGAKAGEIKALEEGVESALEAAEDGVRRLVAHYDDPAHCYYSLPDPDRAPRFNDYLHLARVQEWAALDETE